MNLYTPVKLSFRISWIITLIFSTVWSLLNLFLFRNEWWHLAILVVIIFVLSWIIIHFMLNQFLYKRIRVIYKTLGRKETPAGKNELKERINEPGFFENLEGEVVVWAQSKNTELEGLKKQEQFRREFIGNISHELKTPIFNIQGYILTLLDGGLEDKSVNLEYLRRAEKSINRMIAIISDLETIARLDSGEKKLSMEKFDIHSLMHEVLDAYERQAAEKNINFSFGSSSNRTVNVIADKDKIRQVLNNLIENSIRYGKNGGSTRISFSDLDEDILTEISDDGIGIRENELQRVFERFYRTPTGRAAVQNGSGLGLSIVKHIVEAHGQTINVSSSFGAGTAFSFTLKKA